MMKQALKLVFTVTASLLATALFSQVDVLTQHNNISRTGWNNQETILTKANVKAGSFGLLTSHTVDDQIYAQPLVVSNVDINGTNTNVVYVETVKNTIYAFDADNGTAPVIWQRTLTTPGWRELYNTDMTGACGGGYNDFSPINSAHGAIGIVGTPVIDKPSNTMWFVHREMNPGSNTYKQYLHAVDIRTGAEKANSPVEITAQIAGTGPGNAGGIITFDPQKQNQRAGLLLLKGVIYVAYASHCDWNNYYGWVMAYNSTSLAQQAVWVSGPNDGRGGIWMSGSGITADPNANGGNGSLYLTSGNSGDIPRPVDPIDPENRGESVIRLDPNGQGAAMNQMTAGDWFTPKDYANLNANDLDFSTQTMLIPAPYDNLLITGCKDGNLYIFEKNALGKYDGVTDRFKQKILVVGNSQMHTAFAYFGGTTHQYFYELAEYSNLKAYPVSAAGLGNPVDGVGDGPTGAAGGLLSVSSNGSNESTAILWAVQPVSGCNANQQGCPGYLRAIDAVNPGDTLWSSSGSGDAVGYFSKNSPPTVANGKVYLPTFSKKLNIYGLVDNNPLCKTNVALAKTYTETGGNAGNAGNAFDGNTGTSWTSNTATDWVQVDLQAAYDICKIAVTWSGTGDAGKAFKLQVSNNAGGPWTTIETITGNTAVTTDYTGTYPSSRYVRLQGVTPGTNGDYQLAELQVLGTLSATCTPPTNVVAGNITQTSANITWDPVATANSYVLKYKTSAVSSWVTRTTTNPAQAISQLSCGTSYSVDVQSVCSTGTSAVKEITMTAAACTNPCTLLTRYNHADLGDIGVGGSSCYDGVDSIFTVQGSGDIGGTNDKFQYAYTNLAGNQTYEMKLLSLSNLPGAKGLIMMRDSMSNTSKFVALGLNNGSGIEFTYRTTSGGAVTTVQSPGPPATAPIYLRLVKAGTTYTAYTSSNGTSYTQLGSQNAGFGTTTVYPGVGVSSGNNTQLATGKFKLVAESSPLPITLVDFTGKNVDNKYIALSWTTLNEVNNKEFIVQHSQDGVSYATLTTVKSAGDSDTLRKYTAADNTPFNGANYYRLIQVDLDGRQTILPVVVVNFGSGLSPVVYPNPVTDFVNIISGDEPIKSAALYDITGRKIRQATNTAAASTLKIPTAGLPKGIYLLKTVTATKTYQQKIVKP